MVNDGVTGLTDALSFLFVPGSRPDRYDKAVASGADVVIIDLEDSVVPGAKERARNEVASWLARGGRAVVRVNGIATPWFAHDVAATTGALGVMLPKAESRNDLRRISELTDGGVPLIPLIETARGVMAIADVCSAPGVARVGFGNVDLAAELGVAPTSHPALSSARSQLVYASAASGIAAPVDGVTTAVHDGAALAADLSHGRELGFTAKLLIHPGQVEATHRALRPTAEEIDWAKGVLASTDAGVGMYAGNMVDEPVLVRARRLLSRTRASSGHRALSGEPAEG
jgi:citrate lyase subunit beta/citryl-CoA lyase